PYYLDGYTDTVPARMPFDEVHVPLLRVPSRVACKAIALACVLAFVSLARTQQPAAKLPEFTASTTSAAPVRGQIIALGKDGSVRFTNPAVNLTGESLIALRQAGRALPPWPRGPQVILANGDRIALANESRISGGVVGGDDKAVRVRPESTLS